MQNVIQKDSNAVQNNGSAEDKVLGYYFDLSEDQWRPITPPRKGFITTQAFIICSECQTAISSVGGPRHGSICTSCWDNYRLFEFLEGKISKK